jgi:hypothetical protein
VKLEKFHCSSSDVTGESDGSSFAVIPRFCYLWSMKQAISLFFCSLVLTVLAAAPARGRGVAFAQFASTPIVVDDEVICRDLHVHYDIAVLEEELKLVESFYMPRHRKEDGWTAIPLRNATGTTTRDGIEIDHTIKKSTMLPCQNSEFLKSLPYISSILEDIARRFETEIGLVRISKVAGLKKIGEHKDGLGFDFYKGEVCRLHIPILTGENVIFKVAGNSYHLMAGILYYTNVAKPHAVYNNDLKDRVHLIIDVHSSPSLRTAILSSPEAPTESSLPLFL